MTQRPREHGVALVMTLVFATAVSVASLAFMRGRHGDALTSRAQVQAIEAEVAMDSALLQTAAVLADARQSRRLPPELRWQVGDAIVRVRLESEGGKIDLNQAGEPLLRALALSVDLPEAEATAFADAVLDWRDENDLSRVNGAEDRDYRRADGTSGAADRPFAHPRELEYLLPVDRLTATLLEPLITVYSGQSEPERGQASREVRRTLAIASGLTSRDKDDGAGGERRASDRSGSEAAEPETGAVAGEADSGGLGSSGDAGRELGRQGLGTDRGTAAGDGTAGTDAEEADEQADGTGRTFTVALDARFANGYEAAARGVVSFQARTGGLPFAILDWSPFIPERSDEP